jgi:hypothetical protein
MMASTAFAFLALALQNSHDGDYGVPIPCRRGHAEQFVDLPKIANRFHVTTVHSEDESVFRCDNSHEPLPARRKRAWNGSQAAVGFRQDAHESNNIRAWRLGSKRIFHLQADQIATLAEYNLRFEWQLPEQFSTELRSWAGFANDKRACSTHIHDTMVA